MEVLKEQFNESGGHDETGNIIHYTGFDFNFWGHKEVLVVRQWGEIPEQVDFLSIRIKVKDKNKWRKRLFKAIPYENTLFCEAVWYLVEKEGIQKIRVLMNDFSGYAYADLKKVTKAS